MLDTAKILVIGAGGLGCELLKDLVSLDFVSVIKTAPNILWLKPFLKAKLNTSGLWCIAKV